MHYPNPYISSLRIFPGTMVKIRGYTPPNARQFAINFQTGPSVNPRDDLALHLRPSFVPPAIIRNSLRNNKWGNEESWGMNNIIVPGHQFEIIILSEAELFKIAINGNHYVDFRHRIPYPEISHLTIDGDVSITAVEIIADSVAPTASMYPNLPNYNTVPQPSCPIPTATTYGNAPSYPTHSPPFNVPMPSCPIPTGSTYFPAYPTGPIPTNTAYDGPRHSGPAPTGTTYEGPHHLPGPMPTGTTYGGPAYNPYPTGGAPYQPSYPQQPPAYQPPHQQGPAPTGTSYGSAPYQQRAPGNHGSPFSNLPIGGKTLGTLAGLGLGAAAGAAALSALSHPVKHVKKLCKPKLFGHSGWNGGCSSSSSDYSYSSDSD